MPGSRPRPQFDFAVRPLPYWDGVEGAPQNTIIGGASLWVMAGQVGRGIQGRRRLPELPVSSPEIQAKWHQDTGYLPITQAAADLTKAQGFYEANPGTDIAVIQMTAKAPTANSKGLRLGSFDQIRGIIDEELEAVWAGDKTAQAALGQRGRARQRAAAPVRAGQPLRTAVPGGRGVTARRVSAWKNASHSKAGCCRFCCCCRRSSITAVFFFYPAGQAVWQSLFIPDPFGLKIAVRRAGQFRIPARRPLLPRRLPDHGDLLGPRHAGLDGRGAVSRRAGRPADQGLGHLSHPADLALCRRAGGGGRAVAVHVQHPRRCRCRGIWASWAMTGTTC